jgi:hypothetical protein
MLELLLLSSSSCAIFIDKIRSGSHNDPKFGQGEEMLVISMSGKKVPNFGQREEVLVISMSEKRVPNFGTAFRHKYAPDYY